MMPPRVERGRVILRHWDDDSGLHETEAHFETIDDLFALCLQTRYPLLVDRVIIDGLDEAGNPHTTTLVFQSVTVSGSEK
jgi:hypothetical protein